MNKNKVSEVQSKLLEINKIIIQLDPAIRSSAFGIIAPYYFKDIPADKPKDVDKSKDDIGKSAESEIDTSDFGSFIEGFDHEKPKDNVMLMTAWLYSQYGTYPIQAKDIKELADSCGLVIPNRSDNTMRQAKEKGKSLFNQQGKGWKLTVSGELFMKNTYKVKKGNKTLPKD